MNVVHSLAWIHYNSKKTIIAGVAEAVAVAVFCVVAAVADGCEAF